MNADGSDQVNLTRGRGGGGGPDWQPLPAGAPVPAPREFCLGDVRHNPRRGTARLLVTAPGPGRVVLERRPGVKRFAVLNEAEAASDVALRVRPRGKAKRRLARTGRVRVRAQVTYRPRVGEPRTKGRRVWLVRKP
jgi:hypothetical protein